MRLDLEPCCDTDRHGCCPPVCCIAPMCELSEVVLWVMRRSLLVWCALHATHHTEAPSPWSSDRRIILALPKLPLVWPRLGLDELDLTS